MDTIAVLTEQRFNVCLLIW